MPRANGTAPAVNVKETDKSYIMELAAPGIKKEYCRVAINDEGNLTIAIENKQEHKHEDKHHHYLRREFSYSNYEQSYTLPDDVVKDQISQLQNSKTPTCRNASRGFLLVSITPFMFSTFATTQG